MVRLTGYGLSSVFEGTTSRSWTGVEDAMVAAMGATALDSWSFEDLS